MLSQQVDPISQDPVAMGFIPLEQAVEFEEHQLGIARLGVVMGSVSCKVFQRGRSNYLVVSEPVVAPNFVLIP